MSFVSMLSDEQPSSGDDSPHTANRKWFIGEKAELATRRETLKRKRLAYNLEQGKREKLAESKKQEQEQRDMVMAQELAAKEAKEARAELRARLAALDTAPVVALPAHL